MSTGNRFKQDPKPRSEDADTTLRLALKREQRSLDDGEKRILVAVSNAYLEQIYARLFAVMPGRLANIELGNEGQGGLHQEEVRQRLYMQGIADFLEQVDTQELIELFDEELGR